MEENQTLTEIDEESSNLYGKSPSEITAARGRLIRKIKKEIKRIKEKEELSEEERKAIEELEERLNNLLLDHRTQLSDRYDKEFIKQRADLNSLITVLPVGVGISIKKVGTCINELKQAKTNKSRIFKSIELLKALGLVAATPVIYTVKFIANHWYLILLIFSLLKLIPWLKGKNKGKEDNDDKGGKSQLEPDPAYDEENEPVVKPGTQTEPGTVPLPAPGEEEEKEPGTLPEPQPEPQPNPLPNPLPNPQPNPGFAVSDPNIGTIPTLTEPEVTAVGTAYKGLFDFLTSKGYGVLIKDQYPSITYVHNEQEFLSFLHANYPSVVITEDANLLEVYEAFFRNDPNSMQVYWIDSGLKEDTLFYFNSTQEFVEGVLHGSSPMLTALFYEYAASEFIKNIEIPDVLVKVIEEYAKQLGISIQAATVIFILYEGLQYGLAFFTDGATLVLPG